MDYFCPRKFLLDSVSFNYLEARYYGRGLLSWSPEKGFEIEAFLTRSRPLPEKIDIKRISLPERGQSIRMKVRGLARAIAPDVVLEDRLDVISQQHLSAILGRVIFFLRSRPSKTGAVAGEAVYDLGERVTLPDTLEKRSRIGTRTTQWSYSRAALSHKLGRRQTILGSRIDDRHLQLSWSFEPSRWTRSQAWRWPRSLGESLSMTTGNTVRLLTRRVLLGSTERVEFSRKSQVHKLGLLSPLGRPDFLDKDILFGVAEFLAREEDSRSHVCRRIFEQLAEASRQSTNAARELLVGTVLEAALRTLYGVRRANWSVDVHLKRFRDEYLSGAWKQDCERVKRAFLNVRNRNAHPDWLTEPFNRRSRPGASSAVDDVILLSRFYGYVILALAGFKGLEPEFPRPHHQWTPLLTISTRSKR